MEKAEAVRKDFQRPFFRFNRDALGALNTLKDLDAAISELEGTFPHQNMSVLGETRTLKEKWNIDRLKEKPLKGDLRDLPGTPLCPQEKVISAAVVISIFAYIFATMTALLSEISSPWSLFISITFGSLLGAAFGASIVALAQKMTKKKTDVKKLRQRPDLMGKGS